MTLACPTSASTFTCTTRFVQFSLHRHRASDLDRSTTVAHYKLSPSPLAPLPFFANPRKSVYLPPPNCLSPSQQVFVLHFLTHTLHPLLPNGLSPHTPPTSSTNKQLLRASLHPHHVSVTHAPSRQDSIYKSTISSTTLPVFFEQLPFPASPPLITRRCIAPPIFLAFARKTATSRTILISVAAHMINPCRVNHRRWHVTNPSDNPQLLQPVVALYKPIIP